MAILFLDTSAVVKRYVMEEGSEVVQHLMSPEAGHDLYISHVTVVETIAAVARRGRSGDLSEGEVEATIGQFQRDLPRLYDVIRVAEGVIQRAAGLARTRALRGYDAIQLASALSVREILQMEAVTFVCSDDALNAAAQSEGLTVINPLEGWPG